MNNVLSRQQESNVRVHVEITIHLPMRQSGVNVVHPEERDNERVRKKGSKIKM